jgi:uncharacterized protein (DUF1330 family)
MAKAYWVNTYRSISDPDALAAYAKLAAPAILGMGGRFVVRGMPVKLYEAGMNQRTVVVEFDSVEQAIATHDCAGYAEALRALGNAVVRDMRVVEGLADSPGSRKAAKPCGYMVNAYHSVKNPAALAAYAKIASTAMAAGGARFLARGNPAKVYEAGMMERTVVVEFDSVQTLIAAYDSAAYGEALRALGKDAAVRDMRVMEGAA